MGHHHKSIISPIPSTPYIPGSRNFRSLDVPIKAGARMTLAQQLAGIRKENKKEALEPSNLLIQIEILGSSRL
jgi:hypothetical protein